MNRNIINHRNIHKYINKAKVIFKEVIKNKRVNYVLINLRCQLRIKKKRQKFK